MKRSLTIAALVVGASLIAVTSNAADWYHGGHNVHHGHHGHHGFRHGGYRQVPYSNYGYGGYYGSRTSGYGSPYGYQREIRRGYVPQYRSYGQHHHRGLHVDIGPLHFGLGGHH